MNEKIRDLSDIQLVKSLKDEMSVLFIMLGFEKQPEEFELIFVSKSLRSFYDMLTIKEIVLALQLNVASKLSKKVDHYQLFSVEYVSEVIHIYLDEKVKAHQNFNQKVAASKELDQPKKSTPQECFNFIKKHFQENKTLPLTADWSSCFDWMWSEKILKEEPLKIFMGIEKPRYMEEINAKIKTSSNLFDKRSLEIQLEEPALKLHLRKKYIYENAEKLFAA